MREKFFPLIITYSGESCVLRCDLLDITTSARQYESPYESFIEKVEEVIPESKNGDWEFSDMKIASATPSISYNATATWKPFVSLNTRILHAVAIVLMCALLVMLAGVMLVVVMASATFAACFVGTGCDYIKAAKMFSWQSEGMMSIRDVALISSVLGAIYGARVGYKVVCQQTTFSGFVEDYIKLKKLLKAILLIGLVFFVLGLIRVLN